jgi:hypothetical protein
MAIGRRRFLRCALALGAAFAAPVGRALGPLFPARWVEAVRAEVYPGPVADVARADVARPARWAG